MNLPELRKDLEDVVNRLTFRQLLLVGAVLSLLVALASYLYLSGLERQQVQQEQRLVNVVVAVGDIPAHSVIRQEQLKLVQLPREIVSAEAILELQGAVGKTT
ncbi:MAG: SAF domain-containing protein, partial [Selenomonadaceae bacterium]